MSVTGVSSQPVQSYSSPDQSSQRSAFSQLNQAISSGDLHGAQQAHHGHHHHEKAADSDASTTTPASAPATSSQVDITA